MDEPLTLTAQRRGKRKRGRRRRRKAEPTSPSMVMFHDCPQCGRTVSLRRMGVRAIENRSPEVQFKCLDCAKSNLKGHFDTKGRVVVADDSELRWDLFVAVIRNSNSGWAANGDPLDELIDELIEAFGGCALTMEQIGDMFGKSRQWACLVAERSAQRVREEYEE